LNKIVLSYCKFTGTSWKIILLSMVKFLCCPSHWELASNLVEMLNKFFLTRRSLFLSIDWYMIQYYSLRKPNKHTHTRTIIRIEPKSSAKVNEKSMSWQRLFLRFCFPSCSSVSLRSSRWIQTAVLPVENKIIPRCGLEPPISLSRKYRASNHSALDRSTISTPMLN
jgi:hypothetical protein